VAARMGTRMSKPVFLFHQALNSGLGGRVQHTDTDRRHQQPWIKEAPPSTELLALLHPNLIFHVMYMDDMKRSQDGRKGAVV